MANLPDGSGDAYSNLVQGDGTASLTFVMPGTVPLAVGSVVATVDNTGGGDTTATLVIRDPSGEVVATKRQGAVIDAGASGTATWALRLDDEGGGGGTDLDDVLFNDPNTETDPRYLDIPVNQAGPSGYWFNLVGQVLRMHATLGAFNVGFILLDVDTSNTAITLDHDTANVTGYTHLRLISDTGDFVLVSGNGNGTIRAATAGTAIKIRTHANTDVIVAVDEKVGFFAATPVARQNITGSRGGNAALASLLTGLANLGLITDSTTA